MWFGLTFDSVPYVGGITHKSKHDSNHTDNLFHVYRISELASVLGKFSK